jgi:hypothetical protein
MPLPEERRSQLDGIVNQMVQNKESDENIQLVVNDFKTKYEGQGPPSKEPGLTESIKALPRTALNVASGIASFPFMAPQWAVGMQEKYSGKPYEGLLTKKIGDKTIAEHAQNIGETIQGAGGLAEPQTEAERRQINLVNLPFRGLAKAGEMAGELIHTVTGSPSAGTLAESSVNLAPLFFGRGTGKELLKKIPEKIAGVGESVAERMYTSAIKPEIKQKLSMEKRSAAMEKGVEKGILPTEGGLEKLGGIIDASEAKVDSIIKGSKGRIKTIDVADSLDSLIDSYDKSGMPPEQYQGIVDVKNKVLSQGNYISIEDAQMFKKNTYKFIRKHYGELSTAVIEAQKAVAHDVMDRIAKQHPEVDLLNKQEGPMVELEHQIQRATKRIGNRDIIGIGVPIKAMAARAIGGAAGGAGAGYAAGSPITGAIAGLAIGIMDTPTVKAALAIALDRASKISGKAGRKVSEQAIPIPPFLRPQQPNIEKESGIPIIPRASGGSVSPPVEGRSPLPFLRREIPAIETSRGILSKEEPQGGGVVRGRGGTGGKTDLDGEIAMAQEAIAKGVSKKRVSEMFKERTGQELQIG